MAINRGEGFGHFASGGDWAAKGHNGGGVNTSWTSTGGRGGRGAVIVGLNNSVSCVMTAAKAQVWAHVAVKASSRVHSQFLEFRSATNTHIILEGYEDGSFAVLRAASPFSTASFNVVGSSILGISAPEKWRAGVWHHFGVKCIADSGSSGELTIYIDGVQVFSLTGINAYGGAGAALISQVGMGTNFGNGTISYSDLVIVDTDATDDNGNATSNTGYLGDVAVWEYVQPSDGDLLQWTRGTPGTGTWSSYLDDNPKDDDTTYLSNTTTGNIQTHIFPNVDTAIGTVIAVKNTVAHRKEQPAFAELRLVSRSDDHVNHFGPILTTTQTYIFDEIIHEKDPKDGSSWTNTKVNNTQLGFQHYA